MNPYTEGYFERADGSHYHGYQDWPQFKQRAEWLVRAYKPKRVFELGCAKGFLIDHLVSLGVDAWGVDISDYAVSEAKDKSRVFAADFTNDLLPFKIDDCLAVSFDVLEHIKEEDLPHVLGGLKQAPRQFHMITTSEYDFGGDRTHYTSKPKQWWIEQFEKYGIKNYRIIHAGEQRLFDEDI